MTIVTDRKSASIEGETVRRPLRGGLYRVREFPQSTWSTQLIALRSEPHAAWRKDRRGRLRPGADGGADIADSRPVNGNGVYHSVDGTESGNNTATESGTYHWLAVYSGDSNNKGGNSGCGTEPVKIAPPPAPPPVIQPPVPVTG
jgi:hypothetical protein